MIKVVKKGGQLMLAPKHLALVRAVLRTHAPHHRAYVFGSRVVLNAADRARLKPHSDLDLALEGPPLKPHLAYALKEASSESDFAHAGGCGSSGRSAARVGNSNLAHLVGPGRSAPTILDRAEREMVICDAPAQAPKLPPRANRDTLSFTQ